MNRTTTIALLMLTSCLQASTLVTDAFVRQVSLIESSHRASVVGDNGRSVGQYQLSRAAWTDAQIAQPNLARFSYDRFATHPEVSKLVAKAYLKHLESGLARNGIKNPTPIQLYMAYNMGMGSAKRFGFNPQSKALSGQLRARYERISKQLPR